MTLVCLQGAMGASKRSDLDLNQTSMEILSPLHESIFLNSPQCVPKESSLGLISQGTLE